MQQASVVLFWFAFVLYTAATVLYAYQLFLRRQKLGWWARFAMGAGFLCQTASIGADSIAHGGTRLTGGGQLILAAWALALLYFVIEHIIKLKVYGTFLIPVTIAFMAAAELMGTGTPVAALSADAQTQLDSWRIGFHVALIVFANAGFAFSAVSSALYLHSGTQLKRHKSSAFTRRLPSLATLQTVARRSVSFAFPVYTIALLLGGIRAQETHIPHWRSDPIVIFASLAWLVYGTFLGLVYRRDISAKWASWIAIGGFVVVLLVAVVARTPLSIGFHGFAR